MVLQAIQYKILLMKNINYWFFLLLLLFKITYSKPTVKNEVDIKALAYLKRYGYETSPCGNGESACAREPLTFGSMIKYFQRQNQLPVTGKLDDATKEVMDQPRCGIPDQVSESSDVASLSIDRKWDKRQLSWSFRNENKTYTYWIRRAFQKWREILPQFTFYQVCSTCDADIFLSFQPTTHSHERNKTDNGFYSEVLAHAYYPTDGTIHFNQEKQWTNR